MKVTRIAAIAVLVTGIGAVVFWPNHHRRPNSAPIEAAAPVVVAPEPATTLAPAPPTTATTYAPAPTTAAPTPVPAVAVRARCQPAGEPAAAAFPGPDPHDGKQWVTVGSVQGVCNGRSPVFHIRGIDTRLLFRSDADSIAVFLVDAKLGLDATSGYSDGDCSGRCSQNQVLVDKAGDYYLMVQAGDGPWQVEIQEYR